MTYAEKLLDQRWQKKRTVLLEASEWECQRGGCENKSAHPTLHVHHRVYLRGRDPWDYPDSAYQVVCDECHVKEQAAMERAHIAIAKYPNLQTVCCIVSNLQVSLALPVTEMLLDILMESDEGMPKKIKAVQALLEVYDSALQHGYNEAKRIHNIK